MSATIPFIGERRRNVRIHHTIHADVPVEFLSDETYFDQATGFPKPEFDRWIYQNGSLSFQDWDGLEEKEELYFEYEPDPSVLRRDWRVAVAENRTELGLDAWVEQIKKGGLGSTP